MTYSGDRLAVQVSPEFALLARRATRHRRTTSWLEKNGAFSEHGIGSKKICSICLDGYSQLADGKSN